MSDFMMSTGTIWALLFEKNPKSEPTFTFGAVFKIRNQNMAKT